MEKELKILNEDFIAHRKDMDQINWEYDHQIQKLDSERAQANDEIKRISVQLSKA